MRNLNENLVKFLKSRILKSYEIQEQSSNLIQSNTK